MLFLLKTAGFAYSADPLWRQSVSWPGKVQIVVNSAATIAPRAGYA
jgi:hypothetical protein